MITLASSSSTRAAILHQAGVVFEVVSPGVDEAMAKTALLKAGGTPHSIAAELAALKAVEVSVRCPGLVIGADQTLDLDRSLHDKAGSLAEARSRLMLLRGRTHALHAAVAVARDGTVIWSHVDTARLSMRAFSDDFLDGYLGRVGPSVLGWVGGYCLEGEGVQLFETVEGDYFSILGLPLLPLLGVLRREGALAR
ncbi:MAG: Maf family protein [Caulobacteraceae bacterium]